MAFPQVLPPCVAVEVREALMHQALALRSILVIAILVTLGPGANTLYATAFPQPLPLCVVVKV